MDDTRFLDEFRPFRRGELALARRLASEPDFLPPAERDVLRYALRLAQLSTVGDEPDDLVDRIGSFRLRLLQLLAAALPTDPARLQAQPLRDVLPRVVHLVEDARRQVREAGLASEETLDATLARKHVALVLGGAGAAGFVFLGALAALEEAGVTPSYLVGASIGSLVGALRARTTRYDLPGLLAEVPRLSVRDLFGAPRPPGRYGLPGALHFDPHTALAWFFQHEGRPVRLADLHIPTDMLATGLRPAALTRERGDYARLVGQRIDDPEEVAHLRTAALLQFVGAVVELAVSRRVFAPVLLGADPQTREMHALDAAGFSASIPALLHYDIHRRDPDAEALLDRLFDREGLVALVDGALVSLLPAYLTWRQLEAGRIGSRHYTVVALDALDGAGGPNRVLLPVQRALASTLQRDRAYWDLYVPFRDTPFFLDLVPREEGLRAAAAAGAREMADAAAVIGKLTSEIERWPKVARGIPQWR